MTDGSTPVTAPPCDGWGLDYVHCTNTHALDGLEPTERATVEQMAVDYLWTWTGRRLGGRLLTVRPCPPFCAPRTSTFRGKSGLPATSTGLPALYRCGAFGCEEQCHCDGSSNSLRLPGPVCSVSSVKIDGATLDSTEWSTYPPRLYRKGASWPTFQDLSRGDDEPGTWSVIYYRGFPVPPSGKIAAGILAAELAKALCNDGKCQLPQRIQTITRQGVTIGIQDNFEGLDEGKTGIWLIDSWIASMVKPRQRSRVLSPDLPTR